MKFFYIIFTLLLCGCVSQKNLNLDNTKTSCKIGENIVITLPSYHTDDADWSLVNYNDKMLKVKSRKEIKPCFGNDNYVEISFEAIKEGRANIKLGYFKIGANVYTETQDFVVDIEKSTAPKHSF